MISRAVYGHLASMRLDIGKNEVTLWAEAVTKAPRDYVAPYLNLAVAYEKAGRYPEAEQAYQKGAPSNPAPRILEHLEIMRQINRMNSSGKR